MSREAMTQAMEALEWAYRNTYSKQIAAARDALRDALVEPQLTGCACRWNGDEYVEKCELHEAWHGALHEWADRAKAAEAALRKEYVDPLSLRVCCGEYATCDRPCTPRGRWQAQQEAKLAEPQGEPVAWIEKAQELANRTRQLGIEIFTVQHEGIPQQTRDALEWFYSEMYVELAKLPAPRHGPAAGLAGSAGSAGRRSGGQA